MAAGTGLLAEHQGVREKPEAAADLTEAEYKVVCRVEKLFEKAKKHRARYDYRWLDFYKMYRGRQWFDVAPSYRHREVINFIFQNIQSLIPTLTDSRPKITYVAQDPMDREFAELLSECAESDWERNNWLMTLLELLYDSHTTSGAGLSSLEWNPAANNGAGAIEYKSRDPFHCYPDPDATDVNTGGVFFIHAEPMDTSKCKRKWPDWADRIRSDIMDNDENPDRTDLREVRYQSPTDKYSSLPSYGVGERAPPDGKTLVIRCFIQDDELIEEEQDDGQGGKEYVQKLKYPNGREIVVAGGCPVYDEPLAYDDGKVPFSRLQNYLLAREFWGISEVENLESPQKIFNRLISYTLDVLTLMGNPIWVVDTAAGIDTDNLFNRPGMVVEKEPGSEVRREEGVQLQPYVIQIIDRMKQWFDGVGGSNDITRGDTPGGVTAASAIMQLQDSAYTRQRLKTRLMDMYLQDVGQQYASRVMQFYTAPRVFRITGKDSAQKYFRMYMDTSGDRPKAVVTQYKENPDTGQVFEGKTNEYELRAELDCRVMTGSSLPFAKAQKEDKTFRLFSLGAIDQQALLEDLEYPNREQVIARMQEAAAQAAAAQGGPGAPVPPQ